MICSPWRTLVLLGAVYVGALASQSKISYRHVGSPFEIRRRDDTIGQPKCPPCFNCQLPINKCYNSGVCNPYDGRCQCLTGFGGDDCTTPLCGGLPDGNDRLPRPGDQKACQCTDGWGGINCNMCQTDKACDPLMPPNITGTCYSGGIVVKENQQMCKVTNEKIGSMLPGRPEVTFSCNRTSAACSFQFWVGGDESFSCSLNKCEFESLDKATPTSGEIGQRCGEISCACIPERYLCKSDSIDISDTLRGITGPGTFTCQPNHACKFSEPHLDQIIQFLTGDKQITLSCAGLSPAIKSVSRVLAEIAAASLAGFFIVLVLFYLRCNAKRDAGYMPIEWEDESGKLMANHQPATLSFEDVYYRAGETQAVMAIMGASGAGKTSFLDILARRNKVGAVAGEICLVGYVDQEDTLMPTLTVYETVLNSALLRLPRNMSFEAKRLRVVECLSELGIWALKIAGLERRVSIACELVTSPAILFLDEPTSGLDAFNAQAVVDCLVTLARNFRRTIIFTIHQPRSDIYAKFDRLILLSQGWLLFSGPACLASSHFASLGYPCPPNYNIADFLIDLSQEPRWSVVQSGEPLRDNQASYNRHLTWRSGAQSRFSSMMISTIFMRRSALQAEESPNHGFERPSLVSQFAILSQRAFTNLLCGVVYYQVADDIKGCQNRIGLFFFICLPSERILFMRERANGYYHPVVYFGAKVLFDLVPLRVVPPLLLGVVVYPLVGLNPGLDHFGLFLAALVLFNLTVASFCLLVGIVVKDLSLANLLTSVILLISMIFSGPFLRSASPKVSWIQGISFFHNALEAMLANEMGSLQIHDTKYGLVIDLPAAPMLQVLGFNASAILPNLLKLSISLAVCLVLAYLALHFLAKEKR
ncbi:FAD-dependent urate hydroxylase [Massospora cicadina]|nr:FAD-dependent urate hydroxylase [Massospora cicadina]